MSTCPCCVYDGNIVTTQQPMRCPLCFNKSKCAEVYAAAFRLGGLQAALDVGCVSVAIAINKYMGKELRLMRKTGRKATAVGPDGILIMMEDQWEKGRALMHNLKEMNRTFSALKATYNQRII